MEVERCNRKMGLFHPCYQVENEQGGGIQSHADFYFFSLFSAIHLSRVGQLKIHKLCDGVGVFSDPVAVTLLDVLLSVGGCSDLEPYWNAARYSGDDPSWEAAEVRGAIYKP